MALRDNICWGEAALAAAKPKKEWRKCPHHPDVDPDRMWGCPDCLAELRMAAPPFDAPGTLPEDLGFDDFISLTRQFLERYPATVFDGSSGDSGALFVVVLRKAVEKLDVADISPSLSKGEENISPGTLPEEPEWTHEAPTEPGLYWYAMIESSYQLRTCRVHDVDGVMVVYGADGHIPAAQAHRVWAGPLREPVGHAAYEDRAAERHRGGGSDG